MLFLLSPAKALNFDPPSKKLPHTLPLFMEEAKVLANIMREKTPAELASLMKISDSLATLNAARFQAWSAEFTAENSKQALLAFDGDVYTGLDAQSLHEQELLWADEHLVILSGLYGLLRPLDWMQPYRLEMGTKLANPKGADLYAFWRDLIANELNKRLQSDKTPVIINLASQEYFKSIDLKKLKARVVECVFEDYSLQTQTYKIVSFYAKRARGMMARFAIHNKISTPQALKAFDVDGYAFCEAASQADRLVFRRHLLK